MIFINNIKRIISNKMNFIFMLIIPIGFTALMMSVNMGSRTITVAVVDHDMTKLTENIKSSLKNNCKVVNIEEGNIKDDLINMKIEAAFVIDKGFTESVIEGKNTNIKCFSISETDVSIPVKMSFESYLNSIKMIGKASRGDEELFYKGLVSFNNGSLKSKMKTVEGSSQKQTNTVRGLGFLVMSMLYLSVNSSTLILEDKRLRTFYRIFAAPITMRNYMLQNILSSIAVMQVQLVMVFAIMMFLFKADFGPSVLNTFILFSVFSLTCVSLGIAIAGTSKTVNQAGTISTFLSTPMCMLGGCFWPSEIMPEALKRIADFVPTTWAMRGAEKLIHAKSLHDVYFELLVLTLFSIVFFLTGICKRADMQL